MNMILEVCTLFERALRSSYREFVSAYELVIEDHNNTELRKDLDFKLGSVLHWIINYWERIERTYGNLPADTVAYLNAFKYANNQLKHNVALTELHQISGGFSFPISFPLTILPITYIWAIDSTSRDSFRNQAANYKKYLEHKDVMETITKAMHDLGSFI